MSPTNTPLFPPLPQQQFAVIYADPPWDYRGQRQHNGAGGADTGGADAHYSTLSLAQMKKLPVQEITAEDCLLFMWTSSPHLNQAIQLGEAWGFCWATVAFVWHKQKPNPGFYTMSECELCIVMKRGKIPKPRGARNIRQFLSAPRSRHSAKPDEVRARIEAMFPQQKKIELFARRAARGWFAWGNEADAA